MNEIKKHYIVETQIKKLTCDLYSLIHNVLKMYYFRKPHCNNRHIFNHLVHSIWYLICEECRADSRFVPSQWETSLQSNAVSHWLGTNLESALRMILIIAPVQHSLMRMLSNVILSLQNFWNGSPELLSDEIRCLYFVSNNRCCLNWSLTGYPYDLSLRKASAIWATYCIGMG